ncbi:MAG TPA: YtcA family lipoprotein [Verrucomicrobiae bacterium]|nr:YtcA family lipoprotein [Verrucomicrobiae bacterium]
MKFFQQHGCLLPMDREKHSTPNIQRPTRNYAWRPPLEVERWTLNVECFLNSIAADCKFYFKAIFVLPALLLSGCSAADHAPTVDVLGSYFPAWIVCIVIGLALTLITRQLFIGFKLHPHIRPVAIVYPCLMIFYTLAIWLLFFKN